MRNAGKALICGAGFVVLAVAAQAIVVPRPSDEQEAPKEPSFTLSPDNPYGAIVERNIFDLHDPPPPPVKDDKPKEPPANVKLTGILTIFGKKQAMFLVNEPGTAGKQAKTLSLILNEHQREGVLEVLEIDPRERTARIRNEDIESVIHIETNKVASGGGGGAAPGGAPAGPHGGQPGQAGGYQHAGPRGEVLPVRPLRTEAQPQSSAQNPAYANAGGTPSYGYGGGGGAPSIQTPAGTLNLGGSTGAGGSIGASGQSTPQQPPLSSEEQYTLIEAQRAQALSGQADPNLALILPPTPLSQGNQQNQADQAPVPGGSGTQTPTGPTTPQIGIRGSGTLAPGGIYIPQH